MTYNTIISRAKRICNQPEDADSGHWLDSEWLEVLNELHLDFVDETEAILTEDRDTDTVVDQRYVSVPSGMIRPTIIYLNGKILEYKNPKALSNINDNWVENTSGEPDYFYFTDGKIYFEKPADDAYDMVIFGVKEPTAMSTSQTTPFEGYNYLTFCHKILIRGLVAEFFYDVRDFENWKVFNTDYEVLKRLAKQRIHGGVEEGDLKFDQKTLPFISEV